MLRLLKGYEIVIVGDREFRSVELAYWLKQKKVYFALRQKQGNYIKLKGQEYQQLSELGLAPGMKLFLTGVNFTKRYTSPSHPRTLIIIIDNQQSQKFILNKFVNKLISSRRSRG